MAPTRDALADGEGGTVKYVIMRYVHYSIFDCMKG